MDLMQVLYKVPVVGRRLYYRDVRRQLRRQAAITALVLVNEAAALDSVDRRSSNGLHAQASSLEVAERMLELAERL